MGEMKCETGELKGIKVWYRMTIKGNDRERSTDSKKKKEKKKNRERLEKSKTSSSTCASGKATSMMLGWPLGSPFSSREKMTW